MTDKNVIKVKQVMHNEFDEIDGLMTVDEALKAMRYVDTKALIVKKRHDDDEYGLLLLSDIAKQVLAKDRSPKRVNVYEIMAKPILSVSPEMDVRYCARLFERFGLDRAPVMKDDKIVGIVSYSELVLKGVLQQSDG